MNERPAVYQVPADERDVRELEQLVAQIEIGFNHKNPAVLDGRFTDDAVLVVPDGTVLRGWDDLFAYHTARLTGPVKEWTTRIAVTAVLPLRTDVAVVHVRQDTSTPQGTFGNHGTIVAVKKDEAWWIAAMQNTNVA
ncbi:SgcJ/EcaC family oxidoreductase [Micromonospora sp. KC721]|uniref:SgcJ/EcaC family oxidoreductase n=1 Tax=Micromonospora sp. KC721 TaxID=2530380 RepID=UPI0010511633|nr:SgcJ/EcaC family oxidoreductase [Micromonospora sp. KC721]TDB79825.1 SgcJ/EcaC family oxidoreductase [Micromonospora sp. KC721]